MNEIMELMDEGHNVHVFSIFPPQNKLLVKKAERSDLLGNVYYLINQRRTLNQMRSLSKSIGFFGWKHPCENLKTKMLSIAAAKYFSEIAKNLSIDILHAHFNGTSTHTAMLMSERLGVPFTFTCHAVDIFVNPEVKSLMERIEKASAVMTISFYNRDYLIKLTGSSRGKIHVIRACPNIRKLKHVRCKPEYLRILTIARLVEKKGIKYGILAVKNLQKEFPEILYSIVGSGPLESELKKLVVKYDLQKNVKFQGNLDDNLLIDELAKAMIFVLPCVKAKNRDMDGIPVCLMESMYLQIPTISTNISGIPELIENGKEGILVEPENVEELTGAIKTLIEDQNLRFTIGVNARKKIESSFNVQKETIKLLEIWERIK